MKRTALLLLALGLVLSAAYEIGDTVRSTDNVSWSITGPTGHPEVGTTGNIFEMVDIHRKPVMIFFGRQS